MKLSIISLNVLAILSAATAAKKTKGSSSTSSSNRVRSSSNTECYFGDHRVYVSSSCCRGWGTLYAANDRTLDQKSNDCGTEVLDALLANQTQYCNADLTDCSIDYRDFECDEDYISECEALGGAFVEHDETSICTYSDGEVFTTRSLDKATCVPAVCTANEIMEILNAPSQVSGGGSCEYQGLENIKVNGLALSAYKPTSSGGSTMVFIIVVVAIVVVCCAGCFLCKYRRNKEVEDNTPVNNGVEQSTHPSAMSHMPAAPTGSHPNSHTQMKDAPVSEPEPTVTTATAESNDGTFGV